jgi:hypothetical protein
MTTTLADDAIRGVVRGLDGQIIAPGVYPIGDDDWTVVPWRVGPTWDADANWDGPRDPEGYILPKLTLGWQALRWAEENLLSDDVDLETEERLPFKFTNEQIRFILWFYAIDEDGKFLYREVVLQRLKGWGKDPVASVIAAIEFVGPCRFAGWVTFSDDPEQRTKDEAWARARDLVEGDPFARPHPRAWIQIAAVSLKQTKNTMLLFQGLFTDACKSEHSIDIGKETIYAYHGQKQIEAVTSSPRSLEGNRPTLVIKNETHHWRENNEGWAMADAIERNATKAKGGAARTLSITNAYEPSEESVAQNEREAWEIAEAKHGGSAAIGLMYDSLEAPKGARLIPKFHEEFEAGLTPEEKDQLHRRYLTRVLEKVRGDAWWLDIPSLIQSILNPNKQNTASRSRRFWFNQITAAEDAWVDPFAVDAAISALAKDARARADGDSLGVLHAGWLVLPDEPVVLFFDGSKSDDSTALVGCRLRDGYIFTVGIWQKPRGDRGEGWLAPRPVIDARVKEAFVRFNVVAFWGDPSHAKDDSDDSTYWMGMLDKWSREYRVDDPEGRWKALDPQFWPIKSGARTHAVNFDMTAKQRQEMFVEAAEEFVMSMEQLNDVEEFEPAFEIDGHPALVTHLKNAIAYPTEFGVSLMKEHRESARKIDLAVAAVGARMLRRIVLNIEKPDDEKPPAEIWGV